MEPKGNVLFSGLKRLIQRMLFIALLLFYLAVRLVEKNLCIYPLKRLVHHIKQHEVLSLHTASQQTATHFLDVKSITPKTESITSMLSSQQKEDSARNRHIVKEIIDVLILCGRQNIAIGGRQK